MTTPPREVCIVMLTALGDAVRVLPVVNALKRHDQATRITWALQPGPAALVRGHPAIDEIVLFERARGWRAFLDYRRAMRGRRFDLVLGLQSYLKAGILTALTPAPVRLGYDRARAHDFNWLFTNRRIPPRVPGHVQDEFLEFVTALGIPAEPVEWKLAPTPEERAQARSKIGGADGPLVGLVLASTGPHRCWVTERWAEVAGALRAECGARCVLLGATSAYEVATAQAILAGTAAEPINALGSGLRVLLALLEACDIVVAPDTGPLHMAVAMDVPVVGLYGYTNPKRAGPYRKFGELLVDAYGDPGEDYRAARAYRTGRMARITAREVIEKVRLGLARYAPAPPWRRAGTASGQRPTASG